MIIQRATEQQMEEIKRLSGKVMEESSVGRVGPDMQKATNLLNVNLQMGGYYLVAVKEPDTLMGWLMISRTIDYLTGQKIGFFYEYYVRPEHRKQGVGRKLLQSGILDLKKNGYKKVQGNVFAGNTAKLFYERIGFKDVSTLVELDLSDDEGT
ncbi:GNAT family N-acetyltransferase [Pseudalkalibacillus caeni]|uniref:GNAT family N-acetyltransferase n=1 Tax=Exobacillus caeni TaxID=2574798 RepID=A0A5R9F2G8_9BACL|nr:GNAT family N-acetyltransferase [Pseudalkalibacillus caeni]TLS37281.1 GNAT family N-acetyltransferase [Pseudalkalibacillus caeni]